MSAEENVLDFDADGLALNSPGLRFQGISVPSIQNLRKK
jgi:hypothetical protein